MLAFALTGAFERLWGGLSDFNIAHCAMIDEVASVLGHRLGYLPNAHPIFAGGAQHNGFLFGHDTQTRHCDRL
jgi:hypothetical protein